MNPITDKLPTEPLPVQGLLIDQASLLPVAFKVSLPDGGEERVVLYLDSSRNLVHARNHEALRQWLGLRDTAAAPALPTRLPPARPGEIPGIRYHVTPEGVKVVDSVDPVTQQAMLFFTGSPCFFDGCAGLKAAYLKDLERIQGADGTCSDCDLGDLKRKYIPKVIEKLRLAGWT